MTIQSMQLHPTALTHPAVMRFRYNREKNISRQFHHLNRFWSKSDLLICWLWPAQANNMPSQACCQGCFQFVPLLPGSFGPSDCWRECGMTEQAGQNREELETDLVLCCKRSPDMQQLTASLKRSGHTRFCSFLLLDAMLYLFVLGLNCDKTSFFLF